VLDRGAARHSGVEAVFAGEVGWALASPLSPFSKCIYGAEPDDPPALEKWVLVPAVNGGVQIENGGWCLDLNGFTLPCATGDPNQRWFRTSAGNGLVHVVNRATSPAQCLDSFWTFKACTSCDQDQKRLFKLVS
jgi:hypothetical protein